jgi:GT2 family glycosyltransferase/glycosyltransferase involved in cell wall biosynthesis
MPVKRPTSRLVKRVLALAKPIQRRLLLRTFDPYVRAAAQAVFAADHYFQANPDIADSGLLPAIDYFLFGAKEGRDPHPLFSTSYYLERNPDVAASSQNPLLHYLRFGAAEGRNPHWLFDTSYYVSRYPDLKQAFHPFIHYLLHGQFEHRQPTPFFDPEFYLATQVDTYRSGAITHYQQHGFREGRSPAVDFDPAYYLRTHQDVARARFEPFMHYVQNGKAEGRRTRSPRLESGDPKGYLPLDRAIAVATPPKTVNIVIPVYRGLAETRACLESLFASDNTARITVTVINDATPEPELAAYLETLAGQKQIHLIEHQSNKGFVASVNEGMSIHPESDVLLLNSDTEVFGNWLDRLAAHAYSGRVASVTPFSNNATICSYPKFCENNTLPPDTSAADLDLALFTANAGRRVVIPTAVGFCMYIRRDALDDVGLFDEATFGRGYGEENDFCMRALYRGWSNLLAADTFVYHAGAVSFGPATGPQQQAMKALLGKHPRYMDHVSWHFQINPANAYRIAATLYRLLHTGLPVRLNILHSLGGGTTEHARKLERLTLPHVAWVNLEPAAEGDLRFYCERPGFEFSVTLETIHDRPLLLEMLRYLRLNRIHVHHIIGLPLDVRPLIRELGVPYDVTLHDYYFICPRINLKDDAGRYCGEAFCRCEEAASNGNGQFDLFSWRAVHGAFLSAAARVIAPSADAAERIQRYFPWLNVIPAWHEQNAASVAPRLVAEGESLKVAVLGAMALHKGFANLRDCVNLAAETAAPVEFIHIGGFNSETSSTPHQIVSTGGYWAKDLPGLLQEHAPHLVWFPCTWPETFSYTLSACLEAGLPVAVPDLGAFAERLDGREWSWVLPWDTTPRQWLDFFVRIRRENFRPAASPAPPRTARKVEAAFYPEKFLNSGEVSCFNPAGFAAKRTVLAILSAFPSGQVQACGYVRLVQPLTHPAIASDISFHAADVETALRAQADAIIVQRTAVTSLEHAARLIDHCRKSAIRLVYEIDDDLFRLPVEHPEHAHYAETTRAATLIARAADAVTVSTEALRQMLLRYNENVILIPNYVDERLWIPPDRAQRSAPKRLRGLYMGTSSHLPDLALLEAPVRLVSEKFGFELEVIGVSSDAGPSPWYRCAPVPHHLGMSYPNFVKWLTAGGPWDFGLAPLHESRFNTHKSGIKAYEYAALGLPTIASAVVPYCHVIEDSKTGLLVRNTTAEWSESLLLLCESASLRHRLSNEIHARRHEWTLAHNAASLRAAWIEALFRDGRLAVASVPALEQAHKAS